MAESVADMLAATDESDKSDCTLVTIRSRSNSSCSVSSNIRRFWANDDTAEQQRASDVASQPFFDDWEVPDSPEPAAHEGQEVKTKRSRGRPPNIGEYIGLAAAQRALKEAKGKTLGTEAELAIARQTKEARQLSKLPAASEDLSQKSAEDLSKSVTDHVNIIENVAKTSKNLKGTYVKALNQAAMNIAKAFDYLSQRTISDETRQLQAANNRLQAEMVCLRAELAQLKAEVERAKQTETPVKEVLQSGSGEDADMPDGTLDALPALKENLLSQKSQPVIDLTPASKDDEFMRAVALRVGEIVSARLDGLEAEGRLLPAKQLRPALATDKKKQVSVSTASAAVRMTAGTSGKIVIDATKKPQPAPAPGVKKKATKKATRNKGGTQNQPSTVTPIPRSLPPAPATMKEGWNLVASKGNKRKNDRAAPVQLTEKAKAQKLKAPRSAAVVLTLQPEAVEKGITYRDVIAEAKTKVQLADIDIPGGLRFRRAATGACVLEIPGASSGDKADKLADAIRQQIDGEKIRVSRPTKTVDIRVTGLDDSVTSEEVVAAVARTGGCTIDTVKAGEIRQGFSGLGTVWVQCPIVAAKKVVAGGRLLVGWVSAQVKLLEKRPLRCFRCLRNGHVRAQCTAETDRSETCFQCGKEGHKAANCTAAPHCAECAAASKPSEHRIGSKACTTLKNAGKLKKTNASGNPRALSQSVVSPTVVLTEEAQTMAVD
ncbi:uncharacterized protein LOC125236905 [Leguminivora glycinivorella]|uniref:uncharacterized protein LOC125236905 n=1 Tax=Leguminivora glycinivorella TaxID=1035111 RepID=UPI00200F5EB3|nr:uncharacterized protein LOC125236905 [Leguminivora glycinivorella]